MVSGTGNTVSTVLCTEEGNDTFLMKLKFRHCEDLVLLDTDHDNNQAHLLWST